MASRFAYLKGSPVIQELDADTNAHTPPPDKKAKKPKKKSKERLKGNR